MIRWRVQDCSPKWAFYSRKASNQLSWSKQLVFYLGVLQCAHLLGVTCAQVAVYVAVCGCAKCCQHRCSQMVCSDRVRSHKLPQPFMPATFFHVALNLLTDRLSLLGITLFPWFAKMLPCYLQHSKHIRGKSGRGIRSINRGHHNSLSFLYDFSLQDIWPVSSLFALLFLSHCYFRPRPPSQTLYWL